MSSALRSLLTQGGESSAAARALLIIGAAASGLDLTEVREEIFYLMSSRLRSEVRTQLLALIAGEGVQPSPVPIPQPLDAYADGELLLGDAEGVGFDV